MRRQFGKPVSRSCKKRVGGHQERGNVFRNNCFESRLKLGFILGFQKLNLEANRSRRFLYVLPLRRSSYTCRVQQRTHGRYARLYVP